MKDSMSVELVMEQKMCDSCKKSSSEYYELELQLRYKYYSEEEILDLKEKTMKLLEDNFNTINKVEEIDNGFDIYFRKKSELGKISTLFVKKYFVHEKRSSKLVGRDNLKSKDTYRHFQLITLVNIGMGDIVSIKGKEYKIKAINKGNVLVLLDQETGSKKVMSYSIIHEYFRLINKKDKNKE